MKFSVVNKNASGAVLREVETKKEFTLSWPEVTRFFHESGSSWLLEMNFPNALEAGLFSLVPVYNKALSNESKQTRRFLGFLIQKLSESTKIAPESVIEKFDEFYKQTFGGQNV